MHSERPLLNWTDLEGRSSYPQCLIHDHNWHAIGILISKFLNSREELYNISESFSNFKIKIIGPLQLFDLLIHSTIINLKTPTKEMYML